MDQSGPRAPEAVLEHVAAGIITIDRGGTIVHANEAVTRLLGIGVEELVGRRYDDPAWAVRDQDGRWLRPEELPVARALRGETVLASEVMVGRRADQTLVLHASAVPVLDERGEFELVVATVQDVTHAWRSRSDLEATQARLSAVFTHAAEGMVLADDEGRYLAVNPAAAELLGRTQQEMVGRRVAEFIADPIDQVGTFDEFVDAGRGAMEVRMRRTDGTTVVVDAMSVANVEPGVHLSVWRDVTLRRRAEQALHDALEREHAATEELVRINRMKDTFLSAVSHELRTPLTSIVGLGVTLLEHGRTLDEERRTDVTKRLVANAHRLQSLLEDLLDVNRLRYGAAIVRPAATSLQQLGQNAVSAVEETSLGSHVLVLDAPDTTVALDGAKVARILENLVANAVRHTADGSRVEVRLALVADEVRIEVEDDGAGFPADVRDVAFEMFAKGSNGRAATEGTGIGLSLVREFTALLGGRAEVAAGRLGGALVRVTLPVRDSAATTDVAG